MSFCQCYDATYCSQTCADADWLEGHKDECILPEHAALDACLDVWKNSARPFLDYLTYASMGPSIWTYKKPEYAMCIHLSFDANRHEFTLEKIDRLELKLLKHINLNLFEEVYERARAEDESIVTRFATIHCQDTCRMAFIEFDPCEEDFITSKFQSIKHCMEAVTTYASRDMPVVEPSSAEVRQAGVEFDKNLKAVMQTPTLFQLLTRGLRLDSEKGLHLKYCYQLTVKLGSKLGRLEKFVQAKLVKLEEMRSIYKAVSGWDDDEIDEFLNPNRFEEFGIPIIYLSDECPWFCFIDLQKIPIVDSSDTHQEIFNRLCTELSSLTF